MDIPKLAPVQALQNERKISLVPQKRALSNIEKTKFDQNVDADHHLHMLPLDATNIRRLSNGNEFNRTVNESDCHRPRRMFLKHPITAFDQKSHH